MTDPDQLRDPREMDEEELADVPVPPPPVDPSPGQGVVVEEEYAEGRTNDAEGAEREAPAGEDYAGSGF